MSQVSRSSMAQHRGPAGSPCGAQSCSRPSSQGPPFPRQSPTAWGAEQPGGFGFEFPGGQQCPGAWDASQGGAEESMWGGRISFPPPTPPGSQPKKTGNTPDAWASFGKKSPLASKFDQNRIEEQQQELADFDIGCGAIPIDSKVESSVDSMVNSTASWAKDPQNFRLYRRSQQEINFPQDFAYPKAVTTKKKAGTQGTSRSPVVLSAPWDSSTGRSTPRSLDPTSPCGGRSASQDTYSITKQRRNLSIEEDDKEEVEELTVGDAGAVPRLGRLLENVRAKELARSAASVSSLTVRSPWERTHRATCNSAGSPGRIEEIVLTRVVKGKMTKEEQADLRSQMTPLKTFTSPSAATRSRVGSGRGQVGGLGQWSDNRSPFDDTFSPVPGPPQDKYYRIKPRELQYSGEGSPCMKRESLHKGKTTSTPKFTPKKGETLSPSPAGVSCSKGSTCASGVSGAADETEEFEAEEFKLEFESMCGDSGEIVEGARDRHIYVPTWVKYARETNQEFFDWTLHHYFHKKLWPRMSELPDQYRSLVIENHVDMSSDITTVGFAPVWMFILFMQVESGRLDKMYLKECLDKFFDVGKWPFIAELPNELQWGCEIMGIGDFDFYLA